ncbi:glycosyltransferase family 2 protein [Methyloglobulus sp.]|uniref:glycosyltransferase family 2 protein n=1 Tax=Methyloglobulus sp. TaxID=2518622 RepID=UPI003989B891
MLSIITAVYNQKSMNELYWENLSKYTHNEFELIVIDNGSDDGSVEFFESVGAKIIRNGANYSYPYCQNRGIEAAQYDWLVFLNNDIIVPRDWDTCIMDSMNFNGLDVATSCGVEQVETKIETRKLRRRWNNVKLMISLLGQSKFFLLLAHKVMYQNWPLFCEQRYQKFEKKVRQGFVGSAVVMKRAALDKIGLWDERLQAADYDLYFRVLERSQKTGDIKPVHICLDIFVHHYIRLTSKNKYPPLFDKANFISIEDKWGKSKMNDYFELMSR